MKGGLFTKSNPNVQHFVLQTFDLIVECIESINDDADNSQISQLLKLLRPQIWQRCVEQTNPVNDSEPYALCHGDFSTSNLLFQYSGIQLTDVLFVS